MAKVLSRYDGFDVVCLEIRLKSYKAVDPASVGRWYFVGAEIPKKSCLQLIEEKLEPTLGELKWEVKESEVHNEEVRIAKFRPMRPA